MKKEKKERCLRRAQLWWSDTDEEAYYYHSRSGKYKIYHYRKVFPWAIWKEDFKKFGITKDDLRKGIVYVEEFPRRQLRFIKKEKQNSKNSNIS